MAHTDSMTCRTSFVLLRHRRHGKNRADETANSKVVLFQTFALTLDKNPAACKH